LPEVSVAAGNPILRGIHHLALSPLEHAAVVGQKASFLGCQFTA
jgi:hypothetical protein